MSTQHVVLSPAPCTTLSWTIDSQGGGKRIVHARARRRDRALCGTCHTLNPDDRGLALPGFLGSTINPDGKPMTTTPPLGPPRLDGRIATWDYVKRLKDATSMKVVLKGIVTREDAELALEYGADGIWVSNHGGRMENSLRSSVECVPDVAAGVAGRAPIIVDGASAAAPTSSRHWPSARRPRAWGAPTSSASPRSDSPASRPRSTSSTASCGW